MTEKRLRFATILAAAALAAGCAVGTRPVLPSALANARAGAIHAKSRTAVWTAVIPPMIAAAHLGSHVRPLWSFYNCGKTAALVYLSDIGNDAVDIFNQTGLKKCGEIDGFHEPQGMTVKNGDLYVANTEANDVVVFHRGALVPFLTMTDPNGEYPVDVKIAHDGTVVASNIASVADTAGSLSTFTPSGTFVGDFVLTAEQQGLFIAAFSFGTLYIDGFDTSTKSALWSVKCPAGACGTSTELGNPFTYPGGLDESDSSDLVASDQSSGMGDTFELPSLTPVTFANDGGDNVDMVLSKSNASWYAADATNDELVCYQYAQAGTSAGSCGTASAGAGGIPAGVAVDPPGF